MTFSPILGYKYKNCKNIIDAFPEGTDPIKLTYDNWTKAAKLVKSSKKVVCSYPITTMWSNVLGTMLICYTIIKYVRPKTVPGLITLEIESVSSYIKGKQQQRINTMVEELRNDDTKIRNDLRQHRNELLMYGRYNLNSLKGVINTINALHDRLILKEQ